MLFQKLRQGLGTPLFTKQNAKKRSDLCRKGYHTVGKIAKGVDSVGDYARSLAAPAGMYNPVLGGITSAIGGISPLVSKTLKDVVTSAKNTKKSIERPKPQKSQDIYS